MGPHSLGAGTHPRRGTWRGLVGPLPSPITLGWNKGPVSNSSLLGYWPSLPALLVPLKLPFPLQPLLSEKTKTGSALLSPNQTQLDWSFSPRVKVLSVSPSSALFSFATCFPGCSVPPRMTKQHEPWQSEKLEFAS